MISLIKRPAARPITRLEYLSGGASDTLIVHTCSQAGRNVWVIRNNQTITYVNNIKQLITNNSS